MTQTDGQELEVKFLIADLAGLERRLGLGGAALKKARLAETNLRFDLPDGSLTRAHRALRLRQDDDIRLTYKGPSVSSGGARLRQELEFSVSSFEMAQAFLEALGYQVSMAYEKYRTTYVLPGVEIVLDEMPYGNFAEIEGHDPQQIQSTAALLHLDWEARVPFSYVEIFDLLKINLGLALRDLTFANFRGLPLDLSRLGIKAADVGAGQA